VWYLSSAATICNGCSQGCNIDLHYVLDRPHLNDGARVVRIKPRYNPDVNEWWMCDEGRYGFGWLDTERLTNVRGPMGRATWEQALTVISEKLGAADGARVGVIASAQLTIEELFLIRELFAGAMVSANVHEQPGSSDDFLIKSDKTPNTAGAALLGLAGPDVLNATRILDEALSGNLDALWVFAHDLTKLLGDEQVRQIAQKTPLFIYSGTNENPAVPLAHWVLPSAAYVEKDGTFVNCHGRVQRIGCAFPPLGESREDWRTLLELASRLGRPFDCQGPPQIFQALTKAVEAFEGLSYDTIGFQGADVQMSRPEAEGAAR
jgi:NADH-quinone oxidoreductase subunit G